MRRSIDGEQRECPITMFAVTRWTHIFRSKSYLILVLVSVLFRGIRQRLRLVGKSQHPSDSDRFLRAHFRQLLIGRIRITCRGVPSEGAGSQALMMICAIAFARSCGLEYVHTPFVEIAHADRPMEEWVSAWENQFNLGHGEKLASHETGVIVDSRTTFGWSRLHDLRRNETMVRPALVRNYYLNKTPRTNEVVTIGVHLRRGDYAPGYPLWTEARTVARTLLLTRSILDKHELSHKTSIFSHGDQRDLHEEDFPGSRFFLNADALWTLRELIEADILIMSKSTFSYVAAIISDGIKICQFDDRFPLLEGWVVCSRGGDFSATTFEHQLQRRRQNLPFVHARD